ncbi:MAG TPA: SDR family NAD(P)-dependent oxidoreductase, partial [Clostridia bacterium]|nr:SDR family NAD(P)-dependent oxidoreductase [Clostridia bacterium]
VIGGTDEQRRVLKKFYTQAQILDIDFNDSIDVLADKLDECGTVNHIIFIAPHNPPESMADDNLVKGQESGVILVFKLIKAMLCLEYEANDLSWTIITTGIQSIDGHDETDPTHAGLLGLAGSMAKEYPNWKVRFADMEATSYWPVEDIFSLPWDGQGNSVAYRGGEWYRQKLIPVSSIQSKQASYRTGGVYVVIGGAGGIGEAWTEYMVSTYKANVIWIGRREKDENIKNKLERIAAFGPKPRYIKADASVRKELGSAYARIKELYPHINGVIHSAIVLQDQSLRNMKEERFKAALSAKVDVCVRIAQVFKDEPLDFVMFFSSMQSFTKLPGQSNYAAGCTFKDAFAQKLSKEWKCAVKVMNWGYWGSQGIVASNTYRERMEQVGLASIEPVDGMKALETLLAGPLDQIGFMKLSKPQFIKELDTRENITVYPENLELELQSMVKKMPGVQMPSEPMEYSEISNTLIRIASELLAVKPDDMEEDAEFSDYGFDRVMMTDLTEELNRKFGTKLTAHETANFLTLGSLAEYIEGEILKRPLSGDHNEMDEMQELLVRLLWGQLKSSGLTKDNLNGIKPEDSLLNIYSRWMDESIAVLERNNYLEHDKAGHCAVDCAQIDINSLWKEWDDKKAAWLKNPDMKAYVVLVEATMRVLPEILTGKIAATDVIFPDSSVELVQGIYKDNKTADFFNKVIADDVELYVKERINRDPSALIRIIEIGAGTGGTSTKVFEKLKAYRANIKEYCYTDLSKAFLLHAQKEYEPNNPYLNYNIFNVEKSALSQGIDLGGYDIAIATNVLHATRDIRQTLRNAKAALKNGGLIMLNELSCSTLFTHLTFGLLEGWWLYEDPSLRIPGCPGLFPETWQRVLEEEGFSPVVFPAKKVHDIGQQIVIAQSDGVVRQKREFKPVAIPAENRKEMKIVKKPEIKASRPQTHKAGQGEITHGLLMEKGAAYVKRLISETLKIPSHKIDSKEPLERYGIDSILVVQLANTLRKSFKDVSSTLFFEFQTIDALVDHFIKTQKELFIKLLGLEDEGPYEEEKPGTVKDNVMPQAIDLIPAAIKPGRFAGLRLIEEERPYIHRNMDVAVIGLAGRYAGANNIGEFWDNLKRGMNCITEIPRERWDWEKYFDGEKGKKGSIYTKWGGFIKDVDRFDPMFFRISPVEAEKMDPQERLFLEVAYQSIEDAGYTPANICDSRKVGVFVGVMNGNYPTGSRYWSIANRISYLLNFRGPSMALDTACSSSLTAIHLALESILSGISDCAIVGGVNIVTDPVHYLRLSAMTMLSENGKCKAFGDHADGFVDGEGVGAVILKPLKEAIADGDHIYGIIKGSMINAGGKTNGYTVPNPNAQCQLVSDAFKRSGVNAAAVSYIEAHGTGTALGDPIEISGLTRAFEKDTGKKQFCAIGSVKSNIGHCESAAGIAGITKVLLQLKHRQLVPSLHSKELNPNIDFAGTPFIVQQELGEWKRPVIESNGSIKEYPRIAGISSFGAGGGNAHIVIEEYIPGSEGKQRVRVTADSPAVVVLSAKTHDRLKEMVRQLLSVTKDLEQSGIDLADVAYTLQMGREAMEERLALIARSYRELEEKLNGFIKGREDIEEMYRGQVKRSGDSLAALGEDEDLNSMTGAWISKGKYTKLAEFWVKGLFIDWNSLYTGAKPGRVSLPVYPFAGERYWLSGTNSEFDGSVRALRPVSEKSTGEVPDLQYSMDQAVRDTEESGCIMTFEEVWERQDLKDTDRSEIKTLVCFLSKEKNRQKAVEVFKNVNPDMKVIFISQGEAFNKLQEHVFSIAGNDGNTYREAFSNIMDKYGEVDGIIYLWPFEDSGCIEDASPIVHILQAVSDTGLKPGKVILAARYQKELERCYMESWIGFERSIGMAVPDTGVAAVYSEMPGRNEETDIKEWIGVLLEELGDSKTQSVLYRDGKRHVSVIRPAEIALGSSILRTGETYLITGGCGGLGLLFARYLAKTRSANLILTGRSPIDGKKQDEIKRLEDLGSQVMYIQADVCDRVRMEAELGLARKRFGTIRGALHAAGIEGTKTIVEKDIGSFNKVLEPKIKGTIVLDEILKGDELDFVCYFSSSSAILGDFGSCDYAVANRFQMSYAAYRNRLFENGERSGRAFVVNWPLWREGGMGLYDKDNAQMYLKSSGQRFLETEEGIELFERILSGNNTQHLILAGQPNRIMRFLGLLEGNHSDKAGIVSSLPGKGRRPEMKGLNIEQCVEWDLKELISR